MKGLMRKRLLPGILLTAALLLHIICILIFCALFGTFSAILGPFSDRPYLILGVFINIFKVLGGSILIAYCFLPKTHRFSNAFWWGGICTLSVCDILSFFSPIDLLFRITSVIHLTVFMVIAQIKPSKIVGVIGTILFISNGLSLIRSLFVANENFMGGELQALTLLSFGYNLMLYLALLFLWRQGPLRRCKSIVIERQLAALNVEFERRQISEEEYNRKRAKFLEKI